MESASTTPNRGYRLVRIGIAGLLLTASVLKCHQLATEPIIGSGLLDSRWLLMATVEFELFFGLWLLANVWAKPTWAAALACFGLFTCVSLCKAISGHATCGCFGRVAVNPWYTGTLDVTIVLSLLCWQPRESFFATRRATAVVLLWLAVGVPAAYAMGSYADTTLSDAGEMIGDGKIVVLEPEKWEGKKFPLLPYIEDYPCCRQMGRHLVQEKLVQGDWIVVLYHYDCPDCRKLLVKYRGLLLSLGKGSAKPKIAMIELPPFDPEGRTALLTAGGCVLGRLSNRNDWFGVSPLEVYLNAGFVIQVKN